MTGSWLKQSCSASLRDEVLPNENSPGDRKGWQNSYGVVAGMKSSFPPLQSSLLHPQGTASVAGTEIPQDMTKVISAADGDGRGECKSDEEILPTSASFVVFRCNILWYKLCVATLLQKLLQSFLHFSVAGLVSQFPSNVYSTTSFPLNSATTISRACPAAFQCIHHLALLHLFQSC